MSAYAVTRTYHFSAAHRLASAAFSDEENAEVYGQCFRQHGHNYLLEVRGRKTGRLYSTPVNLLEFRGKRYLVAPRGQTQWARNAQASGEISLKKGASRQRFRLRAIPNDEKPEILKAYLDSFTSTVQRYFPIPAGSPVEAFGALAAEYPAFELLPVE